MRGGQRGDLEGLSPGSHTPKPPQGGRRIYSLTRIPPGRVEGLVGPWALGGVAVLRGLLVDGPWGASCLVSWVYGRVWVLMGARGAKGRDLFCG